MWVRTRKFSNQNAFLKIKNKTKHKFKKKSFFFCLFKVCSCVSDADRVSCYKQLGLRILKIKSN